MATNEITRSSSNALNNSISSGVLPTTSNAASLSTGAAIAESNNPAILPRPVAGLTLEQRQELASIEPKSALQKVTDLFNALAKGANAFWQKDYKEKVQADAFWSQSLTNSSSTK